MPAAGGSEPLQRGLRTQRCGVLPLWAGEPARVMSTALGARVAPKRRLLFLKQPKTIVADFGSDASVALQVVTLSFRLPWK